MKSKKIFKFALLSFLPLTSCYFDVDPSKVVDNFYDKRTITINEKNVVVNVGEEKFVEVLIDKLDGNAGYNKVVFTSCDRNIATAKYGVYEDIENEEEYDGMFITGKKAGYTSIIASYKNACASVEVNVVNSYELPYIHLFDSYLSIENGAEYVLPSEVIYKGETFDVLENDIIYDFAFVDGESPDIVELKQDDDGNILITPKDNVIGSTKVLVSTTFKEKFTSTLLTIEVIDPGVGLVVNNANVEHLVGNKYRAKLLVADEQNFDLDIAIYRNENLVDDSIVLTSDDPTIVEVDGYTIKGLKKGTTKVRGEYEGVVLEIEVKVDKPLLETALLNSTIEVDVDASLILSDDSFITDDNIITAVHYQSIDGDNIFDSYESATGKVKLDKDEFHLLVDDYGEDKTFYIETTKNYVSTGFNNVYSKIIKNYDDLASWGTISQSYITNNLDFNGYFVLGNNIDCGNNTTPVALDRNGNFAISGIGDCVGKVGFNGVFDGKGYTINNYKPEGFGSFITWLTDYGELKNIGFNNVSLDTTLVSQVANPVATVIVNGSSEKRINVSNIYVNYESIETGLAEYANRYCSTMGALGTTRLRCSNVFIDASSATINGDFDIIGKLNCDGVYALGGIHINSEEYFTSKGVQVVQDRIFNCSGEYKHFESKIEMQNDTATKENVTNWSQTYWSNLTNGVPVWKSAN